MIFDQGIVFEIDETAAIWGTARDGTRFKLCITRQYAEQVWRIRYSEAEVTVKVWLHIDELRNVARQKLADGLKEFILQ